MKYFILLFIITSCSSTPVNTDYVPGIKGNDGNIYAKVICDRLVKNIESDINISSNYIKVEYGYHYIAYIYNNNYFYEQIFLYKNIGGNPYLDNNGADGSDNYFIVYIYNSKLLLIKESL